MKKNYLFTLLFTLCLSIFSFGQGTETFTNSSATTAYDDGSFTGDGSITWSFVASRDASGTAANVTSLTTKALLLRRSSDDSKVTSGTISGGIGDFSVKLYKGFTGGGDRQVELFVNGVSRGTSTPFDDYDEHIFSVTGINVTGDIIIEIKNTTSKQVIVDDISWTAPSTSPTLSIITPSDNQVFSADVGSIPVNFNVSNFTLSGDNGSEMTDNTGDGYILGSLSKNGMSDGTANIFSTTGPEIENAEPGVTYVITAELVDNSGASLSPKVESTVTFSVEFPCDIQLATILTTCESTTSQSNTYSTSIAFSGGNSGSNYTITAKDDADNDVGTIEGDDPFTTESGQIIISGVTEGTNFTVKVIGDETSSCDLTRNISSPTCIGFPIEESFDYTKDEALGNQAAWTIVNSGDEMTIAEGSLDYTGLKSSTGNKVTFDESGSETYTEFQDVTSGTVYASFLMKITGFQTNSSPDLADGGYIAALAGSTSGYDARLWVRPNPDTSGSTFDIGYGAETSNPTFTTGTYNLNDVLFIVLAYNMTDTTVSAWINPDASSFEGTIPAATLSGDDAGAPSAINLFILRQDSDKETPFIEIDELRISNSWADVTPKAATASINNNIIEGFATYPNPVTNGQFTVTSLGADVKQVSIFNIIGKRVLATDFSGTKSTIDVSSIASGLYILKVTEGNKTATSKLVIK